MQDTATDADARAAMTNAAEEFLGALIVIARDGTILAWHRGAEALFGYRSDEAIGRALQDIIVPPELREEKPRWLDALGDSGSAIFEAERLRRDGVRIWVDVVVRVVRSETGVRFLILNERDITPLRYQREAQALQTRFRGVLDAAPDAIMLIDAAGRIAFVNSEVERLFGYSRHDLLGHLVEILVPHAARAGHPGHRDQYFADPKTRPMGSGLALSGLRKDGTEFPVEISLSPLTIEGARLAMAAIRDISERLRMEEMRREMAERRAGEDALTRHAQELARSNAELEQFAYVASHDLQEPLRMVANYAQLLAKRYRGRLDADADEFIDYVVDGAGRMHQLITDLLAYSRLGTRGRDFVAVDCEALLARVLRDLRLVIERSGAVVTHDPLPMVVGDESQLGQLFQNLLANAIKFRGPEPPRVHVGVTVGHRECTFSVRDNGIGIAAEYADRIFLIFQRLHTKTEYPGTGIGLAIARKIVERHGGHIWVESQPGHGSAFSFTIPARSVPLVFPRSVSRITPDGNTAA